MNKKLNEAVLLKNKDILGYIMSDLVPIVSDDLKIGFQEADDIVRATELYKVLSSECILRDDYNPEILLLVLRKELVRNSRYPQRNGNGEVEDFYDFVNVMRHEIIYNCTQYKSLKLNLTQVSLLIEGIGNFIVDKNDVQAVKDISDAFDKYVSHMEPISIGNGEVDRSNSFNEIWWNFNVGIQTLLAHCRKYGKSPSELSDEEINLYF